MIKTDQRPFGWDMHQWDMRVWEIQSHGRRIQIWKTSPKKNLWMWQIRNGPFWETDPHPSAIIVRCATRYQSHREAYYMALRALAWVAG